MNELITTPHAKVVQKLFCRQCGCPTGASDNFCRACGTCCHDESREIVAPLRASIAPREAASSDVVVVNNDFPAMNAVVNNRLAVIGIIALIGPLGLPALWLSPRFANRTKVAVTATYVLVTTIVPLMIAWYWLDYSLRPLVEVFGQ